MMGKAARYTKKSSTKNRTISTLIEPILMVVLCSSGWHGGGYITLSTLCDNYTRLGIDRPSSLMYDELSVLLKTTNTVVITFIERREISMNTQYKQLTQKDRGFTIIEVVLVLLPSRHSFPHGVLALTGITAWSARTQ